MAGYLHLWSPVTHLILRTKMARKLSFFHYVTPQDLGSRTIPRLSQRLHFLFAWERRHDAWETDNKAGGRSRIVTD